VDTEGVQSAIELGGGRPSFDAYFLGVATAVAARGDCIRCKVGAVLVERDTHRIISTGYNGSPPGGPSCLMGECPRCLSDAPSGSNYEGCIEIHAESNCLKYANLYHPNRGGRWGWTVTMYVTRRPCDICRPLLMDQQIDGVVYPDLEKPGKWIWEPTRVWYGGR
jgi:dCMP deaminase